MIILSRNRIETAWDNDLAAALATRYGVSVLSIPFLYDLRSFGPTVDRLRQLANTGESHVFVSSLPRRVAENLLCTLFGQSVLPENFMALCEYGGNSVDKVSQAIADVASLTSQDISSPGHVERINEMTAKRWYPVIDERRCTACLECVNFCLFGVYVIGPNDRPVVDQPDACRDGCPACSRVCPVRAIMFPVHEDADIAGFSETVTPAAHAPTNQALRERLAHLDDLVDQVDQF